MLALTVERTSLFLRSLSMDSPFDYLSWSIDPDLAIWELKTLFGKSGKKFSVHLFTKF